MLEQQIVVNNQVSLELIIVFKMILMNLYLHVFKTMFYANVL